MQNVGNLWIIRDFGWLLLVQYGKADHMMISPEVLSVAVIGGGNIGTQFACQFASKGYSVNILSSKPELYDGTLEIVDEYGIITSGQVGIVSDDIAKVVNGCNVVFVTYPAFMLQKVAKDLIRFSREGLFICVVPGTGGAEFAFKECIDKGATLVGLQRVPAVSRLEKYGKRVRSEGLRKELFIASIPQKGIEEFATLMQNVWGIKCSTLPNYLNVTLTPSNPILHTTRLRTLFSDYKQGVVYDRIPFFYADWSDESSSLLIACDEELQSIISHLPELDLSYVRSLKDHYESHTVTSMTRKISSIASLSSIKTPMKAVNGGYIPNFDSRYFTADFPYGLAIIDAFADACSVHAPNIRETMEWYQEIVGDNCSFDMSQYGIFGKRDIYKYYTKEF